LVIFSQAGWYPVLLFTPPSYQTFPHYLHQCAAVWCCY
jgi:hypothetical protein